MCIAKPLLDEYGWNATSLTEDFEFQVKAMLDGVRTTWAHEAIVYDEKPRSFRVSCKQRIRWMQGHTAICRQYFWKLLIRGIREKNLVILDVALYTIQPMRCSMIGIVSLIAMTTYFAPHTWLLSGHWWIVWISAYILFPTLFLLKEREHAPLHIIFTYPLFTLYAWSWIPLTIIGVLKHRQTVWYNTPHTVNYSYPNILQPVPSLIVSEGE